MTDPGPLDLQQCVGMTFPLMSLRQVNTAPLRLPGPCAGCRIGNGEKLSSSQADPGQAIKSAVA